MRIGYPCINRSIGCTSNSTFRLRSYSEERLKDTVQNNLDCLARILRYNAERGFLNFRISSDVIPFASHPVNSFGWASHFRKRLREIGSLVRENGARISMHPDQFIVLNSPNRDVLERSVSELEYHDDFLAGLGLAREASIQIHVGGVYGDRETALERFSSAFSGLRKSLRQRLVVENDHRLFSLADVLKIHDSTGIPVVFDSFHHSILNHGEPLRKALEAASLTWEAHPEPLLVDYSSQQPGRSPGAHSETMERSHFSSFLSETQGLEMDVMLEIKDKEKSAIKALEIVKGFRGQQVF